MTTAQPVTVRVILAHYGIDRKTLTRWIALGMPCLGAGGGMWRRFYPEEVETWLRDRKRGGLYAGATRPLTPTGKPRTQSEPMKRLLSHGRNEELGAVHALTPRKDVP